MGKKISGYTVEGIRSQVEGIQQQTEIPEGNRRVVCLTDRKLVMIGV